MRWRIIARRWRSTSASSALRPEQVVCDLHPDYLSTRLARDYARERGLPAPLAVQHHRAHVASVLADNGWPLAGGPVIGVAMDGTGLGDDGAIWGGEWFVGDYAHLRAARAPAIPAAAGRRRRHAAALAHRRRLHGGAVGRR